MIETEEKEDWLSGAEIEEELSKLKDEDLFRLHKAAKYHARNKGYRNDDDADDLMQQAILLALEGTRQCKRSMQFVPFLIGVMRSEAHRAKKKLCVENKSVSPGEKPMGEFVSKVSDAHTPSHEDNVIELENEMENKEKSKDAAQKLFDLFEDDEEATYVLIAVSDGLCPDEICEQVGIDRKRYETVRTRIRRARNKHFPKGWRS